MLTKRFKFTLLLVFFWYGQANSNDFFIAKKFNWDFVCVTNSSSALSWITDNIEDDISQDSKYAPETSTSTFNTIVENPWLYKNSLESEISEVILDKRWEGMKVYQTEFVKEKGQELKFSSVLTVLKADFVIPFSIRIEKQAHIFLCDGDYVPISNCYWFLLHAWSGESEKSAIRKCPAGAISRVNGVYPNGTCEKLLTSISHWKKPKYFFKDKWSHFQLSKTKNFLRLEKYKNENKFLEYQDMENPIKVTHMIIHSKGVSGLWKIHKTNFIYSNQTLNEVLLGRFTQFNQASLCLSMFVAMCNSCSMKLILKEGNNVLHYQTYYFKHSGWSEIKFVIEALAPRSGFQMNLFVSANSNDPQQFWAIDKIRLCQKQEFRYITTNSPAECQLITGDDVISIKKRVEISENTCPENTIGDFCVPCQWMYLNCDQIQICDKDRCVCSAGYIPQRNNNCRYACDGSFYGHGCQKQCGNCKYRRRCHHVNGSCNSECESMYTGPKCDILTSLLFLAPPTLTDVSYLEATVIMTNFSIQKGVDEVPSYYAVEYAEAGKGTNPKWIRVDQYQFSLSRPIIIKNLKADTEYFVRSVFISNVGKIYDSHVKFIKFKTKCQKLHEDIIKITSKNTSALILIEMSEKLCRMEHYSAYVKLLNVRNSRKLEPPFRNNSVLYFEELNPFTYYTITFKGTGGELKKNFHTSEGVPELVENINITHQSPTTIDLTWPEPILSGKLKHYIVEYQRMSSIACGNQTTTDSKKPRLETKDALATLNHIIPYSKYLLWITAANTEFEGPANPKLIETLASYNVEPEEVPEFDKIVATTPINANVYFNINCDNVRGPLLSVQSSIICTNKWCTEKKNLSQNIKNNSFISIFDLTPFSDYEFEFRFCHGDNCTNELKKEKFKTGPAAPNSVRELEVYSKNENSISLRWKPPFPPNGVLKDYSIAYKHESYWSRNESKNISITACDLWPEFHCGQLFALKENVEYAITVYPRNEEPSHFGQASTIKTTTKTEPSKPPYDLNVTWTSQNDLELEWKHPNQTNGDVQHFTINIALNKANGAVVFTEQLPIMNNIYNLTYYYTVASEKLEPTTKYTISVLAFNGLYGFSATKFETSPPDTPKLKNKLQVATYTNLTVSVTISPKKIRGKTDNYRLILLLSSKESNLDQYPELNQFHFKNLNVLYNCNIEVPSARFNITIGNKQQQKNCSATNYPPLMSGTTYNITIVLINKFGNKNRFNVYSSIFRTKDGEQSSLGLLALLLLLLLLPIVAILWVIRRRKKCQQNNTCDGIRNQLFLAEIRKEQQKTIPTESAISNVSTVKISHKPIKRSGFEAYVKNAVINGELERQHSAVSNIAGGEYEYMLPLIKCEYIHYISDLHIPKAYVISEIPKSKQLTEFWTLIWKANIAHILLIDDWSIQDKRSKNNYWPKRNETLECQGISIHCAIENIFANYGFRKFTITFKNEIRFVEQLHLCSWSNDCEIHPLDFVPFFLKLSEISIQSDSPILVHCSTGLEGAAFILLCDICLRTVKNKGIVDFLGTLQYLNDDSVIAYKINSKQYQLAHLVVLETLMMEYMNVRSHCENLNISLLHNDEQLAKCIKYMNETLWIDQRKIKQKRESDIYFHVGHSEAHEIFLVPYSLSEEMYSYMTRFNGLLIDGFDSRDKYLITKQPQLREFEDFWILVAKMKISVIISLNEITTSSNIFWPSANNQQFTFSEKLSLRHVEVKILEKYDLITVQVCFDKRTASKTIDILVMKNWPSENMCPRDLAEFVEFCIESCSKTKTSFPVLVTCSDGKTASSLYIAMNNIIEQVIKENCCDVCTCARMVRRYVQQFIREKQFKFLWEASKKYLNECQLYETC